MNFGCNPASRDESIVFGAERPGYPSTSVNNDAVQNWIQFVKDQGIKRVCCLLSQSQLKYYREDLLATYIQAFGKENICWAPVADYHLSDIHMLKGKILRFLSVSDDRQERVVVHCSGGIGRTGHVLAAWLVHRRNFEIKDALAEVMRMGRNPFEAVESGTVTQQQLYELIGKCRSDAHE